jgi:hypothetical protein
MPSTRSTATSGKADPTVSQRKPPAGGFFATVPLPITVIIGMEFQVTKAAGSNLRWTFFNNNKGLRCGRKRTTTMS